MKEVNRCNLKIAAVFVLVTVTMLSVYHYFREDYFKGIKKGQTHYVCTNQGVHYVRSNTGSLAVSLDRDGKPVKCEG